MKEPPSKAAHNRPRPFFPTNQPRPQPTAQNWFSILGNLGTRYLFSYLWRELWQLWIERQGPWAAGTWSWLWPQKVKKIFLILKIASNKTTSNLIQSSRKLIIIISFTELNWNTVQLYGLVHMSTFGPWLNYLRGLGCVQLVNIDYKPAYNSYNWYL